MTDQTPAYSPVITNLLETIDWRLNYARKQIAFFADELLKKPFDTLRGGRQSVHYACVIEVWEYVRHLVTQYAELDWDDARIIDTLRKRYTSQVLELASNNSDERTTSPAENYARREELRVLADVAKFFVNAV